MKQFSVEEYLKNPSKKVVTRDGRNVKIHCTNCASTQPVVAEIEGEKYSVHFDKDGRYLLHPSICSVNDLFFASEKHEGWINIYRDLMKCWGEIYDYEWEALDAAIPGVIATVKIEWDD